MKKTLRVLIVEDSKTDAEIMRRQIKRGGYELISQQVETKAAMKAALAAQSWDLVVADFSLPQFSGEEALATLRENNLDIPFILVSGTVGEETAVRVMKAGAHDYLLKDNLERLCPAIEREVGEYLNRCERKKAEEKIFHHQKQLAFLSEASGILGSSLDYEKTIERSIQVAVPILCDFCTVDLLDIDGNSKRLAIATSEDLEKTREFEKCQDSYSKSVLRSPMISRGLKLGSVSFCMMNPDRSFADQDLWVVQEFARRAASAIDNAWLYREAQHAIRARDQFLIIASHELKTPITSLKMNLQITRRGIAPEKAKVLSIEDITKSIDMSIDQVNRLTKLIEDMMDITRMEVGSLKLELTPVNLSTVISDVLERFSGELALSKCPVEINVDPNIIGQWDTARIEQVLVNLISNAIKYAAGTAIKITASQRATKATFVIQDMGCGISKEKQSSIFDRYERATSDKNIGGLGLGLFICRQIIEAHGGIISVRSEAGKGSSFIVELPLNRDAIPKVKEINFANSDSGPQSS